MDYSPQIQHNYEWIKNGPLVQKYGRVFINDFIGGFSTSKEQQHESFEMFGVELQEHEIEKIQNMVINLIKEIKLASTKNSEENTRTIEFLFCQREWEPNLIKKFRK